MPSLREVAKEATMNSAQMLCKDTTYIPSEKLNWRPMEHGKSVVMILSEIARSDFEIAAVILGAPAKKVETEDYEELKKLVIESAEEVCKAIDSLSDEALEGAITMPWGGIFPASHAILLPASHMNYHDGQVNYIQLLLGDTRFHWLEDRE
jgi:uncharacterized damage-inducible protein DinB